MHELFYFITSQVGGSYIFEGNTDNNGIKSNILEIKAKALRIVPANDESIGEPQVALRVELLVCPPCPTTPAPEVTTTSSQTTREASTTPFESTTESSTTASQLTTESSTTSSQTTRESVTTPSTTKMSKIFLYLPTTSGLFLLFF